MKRKTKKQKKQESIRRRFAEYVAKGHPVHDAMAMARHAVSAVKKGLRS